MPGYKNDDDEDYDDDNVRFIKRQFQNETNMPYGYLTLAHQRLSDIHASY